MQKLFKMNHKDPLGPLNIPRTRTKQEGRHYCKSLCSCALQQTPRKPVIAETIDFWKNTRSHSCPHVKAKYFQDKSFIQMQDKTLAQEICFKESRQGLFQISSIIVTAKCCGAFFCPL